MRIYMVRHGETALNQQGCYYGKTDAVLTQKGIRQAERFREFFRAISFDYVIASPLVRAYNTAELILEGRDQPIIPDVRLMEQDFGIFERMTYPQVQEIYPEEWKAWNGNFSSYVIPEGESFLQVRKRMDSFLRELPKGEGTLLLVAHKGTLGHLMAALLHLPLEGYWNFVFEQGCYHCVDLEDGYAIVRKLNQSLIEDAKN